MEDLHKDVEKRMESTIESLKKDFSSLRTGRAHPSLLDSVMVDAYGSMMPLSQCGSVAAPESRLLTVSVWDQGLVKSVEKAITNSNMGLNPMAEGSIIRMAVPELTQERRKDIGKVAGQYAEQGKIAIRNIRRDSIDTVKKNNVSEDETRMHNDKIQKVTDDFIKKIDGLLSEKEKEIMQV